MTPDGNLNLQEEINNDENGKYVGKNGKYVGKYRDSKYVFSLFS